MLRVAAKALVVNAHGEVLIVREAPTYSDGTQIGRYGLPGGRINAGEKFKDALLREVKEEVNLDVQPLYPVFVGEWFPVIKGVPHQIVAVFVVCQTESYDVRLSEEHDRFAWIKPEQHREYDIIDSEREVLEAYAERASREAISA